MNRQTLVAPRQARSDLRRSFGRFAQPVTVADLAVCRAHESTDAQVIPGSLEATVKADIPFGDELFRQVVAEYRQQACPAESQWIDFQPAAEIGRAPGTLFVE